MLVVGGLVTIALGVGATSLEFSTGQDSYLNKSDQVYKDNVAYQKLFGGEAMVVLVTMDRGHTVSELFTPKNLEQWPRVERQLRQSGEIKVVVSPLTALQFNNSLVSSPTGDPTQSVAGKVLLDSEARDPSPTSLAARNTDAVKTLQRLNAVPSAQRTLTNPGYLDFLLHDNQGKIRKPLLANFPDDRHAQLVVRLPGNDRWPAASGSHPRASSRPGRHRCSRTSTTTSPAGC